jgi:Spy/CpxP family protein refolding chaperone
MSENSATKKAALWVGVVFLLGVALGGMTGYVFAHKTVAAAPPQMSDAERRAQKIQRLTDEVGLTPAQQTQIDGVMTSIQGQYKAIHEAEEPQIDAVRQHGREQIRALLTAEQKPKFEEFLKRIDEERKKNAPK